MSYYLGITLQVDIFLIIVIIDTVTSPASFTLFEILF
jgi:hypothetical protein